MASPFDPYAGISLASLYGNGQPNMNFAKAIGGSGVRQPTPYPAQTWNGFVPTPTPMPGVRGAPTRGGMGMYSALAQPRPKVF